jgi:hypothetical protein
MLQLRKWIAILAIVVMAAFLIALDHGAFDAKPSCGAPDFRLHVGVAFHLLVLGVASVSVLGLVRELWWGRWPALACAIAALPTSLAAGVMVMDDLPRHGLRSDEGVALSWAIAGPLFLLCLLGRSMRERYEGKSALWRSPDLRLKLVSAAIVLSAATLPWLVPFGYEAALEHHPGVLTAHCILIVATCIGIIEAARQRVAGLILLTLATLASTGMLLFVAITDAAFFGFFAGFSMFAAVPGALAALVSFIAWAGPMWRFVKS